MKKRKAEQKTKRVVKQTSLVVVKNDAIQPIKSKAGALFLQPTWLKKNQLIQMLQQTPKQHIHKRPGKGGEDWDYVTGVYVTKVLNYVFGWAWDFVSSDEQLVGNGKTNQQVIVKGTLIVYSPKGTQKIVKTQYGRADVKMKRDGSGYLDLGNDYKAASTDALKKCASMLGIASDVYGKAEFKDIGVAVQNSQKKTEIKTEDFVPPEHECQECGNPMTAAEVSFSKKFFKGKQLCRTCQKAYKDQHLN